MADAEWQTRFVLWNKMGMKEIPQDVSSSSIPASLESIRAGVLKEIDK
jgi:hypothetical protein